MGTGSALRPTSAVSLFCWCYYTGSTSIALGNIFRDGSANIWGYWLVVNGATGTFYGSAGNGNVAYKQRYNSTVLPNYAWRLIGFTYDGASSAMNAYFNGVLDNGSDNGVSPGNITYHANNELNLARFNNNGTYAYYPVTLGPAYVFDRVLTADEIARLNALRGGEAYISGGIGAWNLIGQDGATASGSGIIRDKWGSSNGTPGGSPVYTAAGYALKSRRG